MSTWLDDATVAHLRDVADWPELGDRYEIQRRLGRGGMGVVYAAHDRILARLVAVKVLDDLHGDSSTRLLSEARILAQLEHPGIVPVHDAGTLPDGRTFYVMKLVRGERLDLALRTRSLTERLDLFLRICDAVSFAHAHGIVHRDLKPDNIMLGAFGEVLVLDWGVAKVPGQAADNVTVIGTPGFMPPEQQQNASQVDARADVFALGVVLRAMLSAPPPKPLLAIAQRACEPDMSARYETAQDLARDVMRYRDGDPVIAYRENLIERMGRMYRRYQLPVLLVLAYVIMRVLLLVWSAGN
jgi:serine/threonine protein kinase